MNPTEKKELEKQFEWFRGMRDRVLGRMDVLLKKKKIPVAELAVMQRILIGLEFVEWRYDETINGGRSIVVISVPFDKAPPDGG